MCPPGPRPKPPRPPRRCWNCASALEARARAARMAAATARITRSVYSPAIVDRVDGHLRSHVVARFERIRWPRLGGDERRDVQGFLVGQAARAQIRHRVADDPGQRVDPRRAGAVIPRSVAPQRSRLLVADLHALAVRSVTRGTPLAVESGAG